MSEFAVVLFGIRFSSFDVAAEWAFATWGVDHRRDVLHCPNELEGEDAATAARDLEAEVRETIVKGG